MIRRVVFSVIALSTGYAGAASAASPSSPSGLPGPYFAHESRLEGHGDGFVGVPGSQLGYSLAISGDTALVGAPGENAAYVFVGSAGSWTLQQRLFASDSEEGAAFGRSVAVSGDTAIVGASYHPTGKGQPGAAYVFVRSGTTWTQQQKLLPDDFPEYAAFGNSVSISGDTVVVGAHQAPGPAFIDGAAYVFVRSANGWAQQQKLTPSGHGGEVGVSVAISGDTVLVGAWVDSEAAPNAGAAYVFVRTGVVWSEATKLVAPDAAQEDRFGVSVALDANTALIGCYFDDAPPLLNTGAAYAFVGSGSVWSLQQKLRASNPAQSAWFGSAVSLSGDTALIGNAFIASGASAYVFVRSSGDTALVGARHHTVEGVSQSGSAYAFGPPTADLAMSKTDGQPSAVPGRQVTYVLVAANGGPDAAPGARVTDALPPSLGGATWTCVASGGGVCAAGGSGSIDDPVTLPVSATVTYTLTATVDPAATGTLSNTASVALPVGGIDPNPGNDSATDSDVLTPQGDLRVNKTDGQAHATPGASVTYTIVATNAGPSDVPGSTVTDMFPPSITGVTWTCSPSGGASCGGAGGTGNIGQVVDLPAGSGVAFTAAGTVDPGATGTLINTATTAVPAGVTDPEPTDNVATDVDNLTLAGVSELVHGDARVRSLDGSVIPPINMFRLRQERWSSYEVVVDGVTGDVASPAGTGPLLLRLAADAVTVLQTAEAAGAGASRSLRFENASASAREDEFVSVQSAGCITACGPDDTYRIRVWETTLATPRINNNGSQITVLVLDNTATETVAGHLLFWSSTGSLLARQAFSLVAKGSLALNTSTVPGLAGQAGSLTISHDGRYGALVGKTVAVEPATGFAFDTTLQALRR